jgi:hypothetical protein
MALMALGVVGGTLVSLSERGPTIRTAPDRKPAPAMKKGAANAPGKQRPPELAPVEPDTSDLVVVPYGPLPDQFPVLKAKEAYEIKAGDYPAPQDMSEEQRALSEKQIRD